MNVREVLFAFSEDLRLRILLLLEDSDICVNCLVAILGLPQSTISRHLAILRRCNLIQANRKGQNTYYTANPEGEGRMGMELLVVLRKHMEFSEPYRTDRIALKRQGDVCNVDCRVENSRDQKIKRH